MEDNGYKNLIVRQRSIVKPLLVSLLILAVMLFGVPPFWLWPSEVHAAAEDTWYRATSGTYKFRKKLTLDNTLVSGTTDLTNFPVLVAFTDTDLKVTGSGGDVTNSSGYDIIFTNSAGTPTKLDHEIEKYTSTTGEIAMWVRIPTLGATTDTDIYMYYGNSSVSTSQENVTGVWDSNYVGVWHLKEDPSGTAPQMKDSTSGANNGTSAGSMLSSDQTTGNVNGGLNFDGVDDRVGVGSAAALDNLSALTISAWIYPRTVGEGSAGIIAEKTGNAANGWWFNLVDTNRFRFNVDLTPGTPEYKRVSANNTITLNAWQQVAVTWGGSITDSTNILLYRNGAEVSYGVSGNGGGTRDDDAANNMNIGNIAAASTFDGTIDEIRISNAVRSADWIKTEYDNMNNQGTGTGKFIKTAGSEQGWVNSTGSGDTSWVKGGATGSNIVVTVNNASGSTGTIGWVKITRPSSNYTLTAGSATGWSASAAADAVTFTGGSIAASGSTAFTVTVNIGSSDEAQTAWTVDVDDATDGSSSTTTVATSASALKTGIDATAPTVTISGVTVDSTSQLTATANTATDASSGIHSSAPYWFDETSGGSGATDSTEWQSAVTFVDTGLAAGTQYCYRVKARDAVLNESSFSAPVCGTTSSPTPPPPPPPPSPPPTPPPPPPPTPTPGSGSKLPDLTPPVIKNVSAEVTPTTATITWQTDEETIKYIEYGKSLSSGKVIYTRTTKKDTNAVRDHTVFIHDLAAGTKYDYQIIAEDEPGNIANSGNHTFTTSATSTAAVPTLSDLKISLITINSATITWKTDTPATTRLRFGTKEKDLDQSTVESDVLRTEHTIKLDGLKPSTMYYIQAISRSAEGGEGKLDQLHFTTEAPLPVPIISDLLVSSIKPTSAKIVWKTDIPATSQVAFGTAPEEYTQITIERQSFRREHSFILSDLEPSTTYYFIARSRTAQGTNGAQKEEKFRTESLEVQRVVDIARPPALPVGSPGTQIHKISLGETVSVIPILPTAGDTAPPDVTLLPFAKNPTQDTAPEIRGRAKDTNGVIAAIAYSTDGGATWHPIDEIKGIGSSVAQFSARIPHLREGAYDIVFRARDNSGNTGKSDARSLVIDIKPPKIGANTFALGTQTTTTSREGVLTTLAGVTQRIMLSAIGGATSVQVKTGDISFPLTYSKADNLWFGDITMRTPGTYRLIVEASDGAGRVSERPINTVEVASPGKVTDSETDEPVAHARVSLFHFSSALNDFVLWPGDIFNQANPAVTGEDGVYRFIVPAGRYFIKVEKERHKTLYTSITDFSNHSVLNFTLPLQRISALSLDVPFLKAIHIPLLPLPDFLGYKRVSSSPESSPAGPVVENTPSLIGMLAPSFVFSDSAGNTVDVRYLRGKKTILTAWSTWSPLAQIQIPILDQVVREDRENINILLLSSQESKGVVETYLRRGNYDLKSVIDPDGDILDHYPVTTLPQHFFLDRKGIIKNVYTGFLEKEQLGEMLREIP